MWYLIEVFFKLWVGYLGTTHRNCDNIYVSCNGFTTTQRSDIPHKYYSLLETHPSVLCCTVNIIIVKLKFGLAGNHRNMVTRNTIHTIRHMWLIAYLFVVKGRMMPWKAGWSPRCIFLNEIVNCCSYKGTSVYVRYMLNGYHQMCRYVLFGGPLNTHSTTHT